MNIVYIGICALLFEQNRTNSFRLVRFSSVIELTKTFVEFDCV